MAGLLDFFQSASNAAASNLSAPVDGINWLLKKAGMPTSDAPYGGSDWMARQGLTRPVEQSASSLAGETMGLLAPMAAAAKAPQIAKGLLQMGENAVAPRTLGSQRGVFIGPGAKTWNADAAKQAQALTEAGTDARKVWSETGTWKGPDGAWRQEIPDNAAFYRGSDAAGSSMAEDVFLHPGLYGAYPKLGTSRIVESPHPGGSYDPRNSRVTVGPTDAGSFATHEFQHAIQHREGWNTGGSPGSMGMVFDDMAAQKKSEAKTFLDLAMRNDPLNPGDVVKPGARVKALASEKQARDYASMSARVSMDDGMSLDAYRRLAGEAEARATQARIPLNAEQRRATFPADSYDVPIDQLIVRGLLK